MYVIEEPSSDKTQCFYCVTAFIFIVVGYICSLHRNSSFPLDGCQNSRIIIFNEANWSSDKEDIIKIVFAGDVTPIDVKYEKNQLYI